MRTKLFNIMLVINQIVMLLLAWSLLNAATLTWTDNSNDESGFNIYRADGIEKPFSIIGSVGANVVTFNDPTGKKGDCYRVTAFNEAGESQASNNGCLPHAKPNPPGQTKATP